MKRSVVRTRRVRRALTWVGLLFCLFLFYLESPLLTSGKMLQADDYVEYWAAGRLNLSGANPYSPEELAPLENQAGRYFQVPVMMWNPPYTLVIAMPLASLPYPVSRMIWLILNIALLFVGRRMDLARVRGASALPLAGLAAMLCVFSFFKRTWVGTDRYSAFCRCGRFPVLPA